ncbi:Acylphosphatase-like domain-containing protein [Triangularia verruculosa]|uniref:acylphosphatase n=1 Tax=Triangularia verruculosa TaxID=2587418 RepID=A0AAN7AW63_9PEZI|nr:Acylphosphatase-like domain-containing protein [Triangularia verruculosa]
MVKRVYFLAHGGMVQGVGFRYFTRGRAAEHNLTGWVRNTDNNKVEGEAQGEEDSLTKFLKEVDKGPRGSKVVKLDREDRDVVEGEQGFEIRR